MSGLQEMVTLGYPATAVDVQRIATVAATADELTEEILLDHTPRLNGYSIGIVPLLPDYPGAPTSTLVLPIPGGFLSVQPCHVSVAASPADSGIPEQAMASIHAMVGAGATPDGPDAITSPGGLSGTLRAPLQSPQFAGGSGTNPRIDVLYLTIQRSVTISKSRRQKDPTTGSVQTHPVNLAQDVTFTLNIVQGTPASSPTPPAIPASTGTAWNIALVNVAVASGYSSGSAISVSNISPVWRRLWVARERERRDVPATIMAGSYGSGSNGRGSSRMDSQWGSGVKACMVIRHVSGGVTFTLDNAIDWRRRFVKISMAQVNPVSGTAMPLETTTGVGTQYSVESGLQWSPAAPSTAVRIWIYSSSSPTVLFEFDVNPDGSVSVTMTSAPVNSGGDVWYWEITGTDQFTA